MTRQSLASCKARPRCIETIQRASPVCCPAGEDGINIACAFEVACEERRMEVLVCEMTRLSAEAIAQSNQEGTDEELCAGQECLCSPDEQSGT